MSQFRIIGTPADPAFDEICHIVKEQLDVSIVMISLADSERHWFKVCIGRAAQRSRVADILRRCGCDEAQEFLWYNPSSADEADALLCNENSQRLRTQTGLAGG